MKGLLFCLLVIAPLAISSAAPANVTSYNSESQFRAAAPPVTTETFDEFPKFKEWSSSTATFDGVIYHTQYGGWTVNSYFGTHSSPNALSTYQGEYTQITFGQNRFARAFGFWFGVPSAPFQIHDVLNVVERDGTCTQFDLLPPSASETYLGFISSTGIKEVNIADWTGDNNGANWSYDNVSHSAVFPEPSSVLALLCGIGGLGGMIVRRRRDITRTKPSSTGLASAVRVAPGLLLP